MGGIGRSETRGMDPAGRSKAQTQKGRHLCVQRGIKVRWGDLEETSTLLTKVHIVKVTVFQYSCVDMRVGWALKNWYFQIAVLEKILESPLDSKEIKTVNPKGYQPWIFTGRIDAEIPILGQLMWRVDLLEKTLKLGKIEGRRRREQQSMQWLDGTTYSIDISLSKLWEIVKGRETCHGAVHGLAKSQNSLPISGLLNTLTSFSNRCFMSSRKDSYYQSQAYPSLVLFSWVHGANLKSDSSTFPKWITHHWNNHGDLKTIMYVLNTNIIPLLIE